MDAGTIIYFLVILFLAILGFFNKSKKEEQAKRQGKESSGIPPTASPKIPDILRKMQESGSLGDVGQKRPSPPTFETLVRQKTFTPSVSTVASSIEGQSSLKGSLYVEDALDDDSSGGSGASAGKSKQTHSFISGLSGGDSPDELRKAILYSEILNRKY